MFFLRRRKFKISTAVALVAALMLMATELLANSSGKDIDSYAVTADINASNGISHVTNSVIIPN